MYESRVSLKSQMDFRIATGQHIQNDLDQIFDEHIFYKLIYYINIYQFSNKY